MKRGWYRAQDGHIHRVRLVSVGADYALALFSTSQEKETLDSGRVFGSRDEAAGVVDPALTPWRMRIDLASLPAVLVIEPCTVASLDGSKATLDTGEVVHRDRLAFTCVLAHHQARSWLLDLGQDSTLCLAPSVARRLTRELLEHANLLSPNTRDAVPVAPGPRRYGLEGMTTPINWLRKNVDRLEG